MTCLFNHEVIPVVDLLQRKRCGDEEDWNNEDILCIIHITLPLWLLWKDRQRRNHIQLIHYRYQFSHFVCAIEELNDANYMLTDN